jgi:hypothetical protein
MKTNKALLQFAGQVVKDDLLPTHPPDKIKKPKWAKPRKPYDKTSARSYTERFRGNTFDQHLLLLTLTALTGVLRGVLVVMACLEVQIS